MVLLGGLPAASAHAAEPSYSILYSFQLGERGPQASLVSDGSGNLYGTTAYGGSSDRGTVYTIKKDGTGFQRLHDFAGDVSDGGYPYASLTLDGFGNLYGTTTSGGHSDGGTVFKVRTDGTGFQLIHSFGGGLSDGRSPYASLTLDAQGNLYGTTIAGGQPAGYNAFGYMIEGGTVFKLGTDGSGFRVLHAFTGGASEGFEPEASLILDDSGNLYGTTTRGGPSEIGTAFTIRADGTGFKVLHSFAGGASNGSFPYASLTLDASGNLYGTTSQGGASNVGTVFKLRRDGTAFQLLHSFAGGASDGSYPYAPLLLDESGNLYGTTKLGDQIGNGALFYPAVIFKIRTDATGYDILRSFVDASDGTIPSGSLILDGSETLYGTMEEGGSSSSGTIFSIHTDGSLFQVLHAFAGFLNDGAYPSASVISDGSGTLYGTTSQGGSSYRGTVFRIRSDGSGFQLLHAFSGGANDGDYPRGRLILDRAGNLYGTTTQGGPSDGGTVFRLRTDGAGFQLLHTFTGGADDGLNPGSGLILDGANNLYGTSGGGALERSTVFKLKTDGTGFQLLHTFTSASDGSFPYASLTLDASGNLYGTTLYGGSGFGGTIFKLSTSGTGFQVLHSFTDHADDGLSPAGSLILDGSGNLYGTTVSGGSSSSGGTVFKMRVDATGFQLLHSFGASDGNGPEAGLILDGFGNLYGTTFGGSGMVGGTVFTVRTDGNGFRTLHVFGGEPGDGKNPAASLFLDGSGTLIGTTVNGGAGTFGTIFALSVARHQVVVTPGPFEPVRKR